VDATATHPHWGEGRAAAVESVVLFVPFDPMLMLKIITPAIKMLKDSELQQSDVI
jgi:hypothetical protein